MPRFLHPQFLKLAVLSFFALFVSCGGNSTPSISEKDAKEVLEEKYFIIEKTPVAYREEDGLWINTETGELADGPAWVADTGENIDDYIPEPEVDPNPKEPRPNRIGYLRNFEQGKQQGPVIKFSRGNRANVIYYYADNSLELRQRFDNRNRFTLKEYVEMTSGHAEGICWRWYPNGQMQLDGQFASHPDGRHHLAGQNKKWAPDGELLLDADFALDGSGIETIREAAEGFRLAYSQGDSGAIELALKGNNSRMAVQEGSQAEEWLLERATPQSLPLEEIEGFDINVPVNLTPYQPRFGPLPVDLPPSTEIPPSISAIEDAQ